MQFTLRRGGGVAANVVVATKCSYGGAAARAYDTSVDLLACFIDLIGMYRRGML